MSENNIERNQQTSEKDVPQKGSKLKSVLKWVFKLVKVGYALYRLLKWLFPDGE